MRENTPKTPWKDHMGQVPMELEYFGGTMTEMVAAAADQYPKAIAFDFMGRATSYEELMKQVRICARSLKTLGIGEGDRVTVAMPNCPQAVYMFYAINMVGAIANMIHPLSAEKEIEFYLKESSSVAAITLDQFYGKFQRARENSGVKTLIVAGISDALSPVMKLGYALTAGRKIEKIPKNAPVLSWKKFLRMGAGGDPLFRRHHRNDQGHRSDQ